MPAPRTPTTSIRSGDRRASTAATSSTATCCSTLPAGFDVSSGFRFLSGRPIDVGVGSDANGDRITAADRPFSAPGVPFTRNAFRNESLKFLNLRAAVEARPQERPPADLLGRRLQRLQLGQHRAGGHDRHQLLRGPRAPQLRLRRAVEPELPVPHRQRPDVDPGRAAPSEQRARRAAPGAGGRPPPVLAFTSSRGPVPRHGPPFLFLPPFAVFQIFGLHKRDLLLRLSRLSQRTGTEGPQSPRYNRWSAVVRCVAAPAADGSVATRWRSCPNDPSESCRVRPAPGVGCARLRPGARAVAERVPVTRARRPPHDRALARRRGEANAGEQRRTSRSSGSTPSRATTTSASSRASTSPSSPPRSARTRSPSPPPTPSPAPPTLDTSNWTYNFGAFQSLPTGGDLPARLQQQPAGTNSVFSTFNPSYNSNFNLSLTQPLLRNFTIDSTRHQIKVAKKNREISDVQFRQTVVNTVANVKQSYYDLLYAIDNLEAQRKSLALAQKFLEENQIKVRVGTMAPLDVVAGAIRGGEPRGGRHRGRGHGRGGGGRAEARHLQRPTTPRCWDTRIVPTDRPTAEPFRVDLDAAHQERAGASGRTSWPRARAWRARSTTSTYAKNQMLPALDLVAGYGTTGLGGTQCSIPSTRRARSPVTIPGGYGDALSDVFGRDFPTWTLGFNFSYPIFNRPGRAPRGAGAHRPRPAGWPASAASRCSIVRRGAQRGPGGGDELQARGVDPRRARAAGAAPGRRDEEVRGRHVHQLPGHPGPARPGHRRGRASCARSPTTARAWSTSSASRRRASVAAAVGHRRAGRVRRSQRLGVDERALSTQRAVRTRSARRPVVKGGPCGGPFASGHKL